MRSGSSTRACSRACVKPPGAPASDGGTPAARPTCIPAPSTRLHRHLAGITADNMPDLRIHRRVSDIPAQDWDALHDGNPFVAHAFLAGLERHGCIRAELGWTPHHVVLREGDRLMAAASGATAYANRAEPWPGTRPFAEGETFVIGSLTVKTFTTSGHSKGGTTYFIEGLARPLAIVGDALFAGSMGGGIVSFADAWKNNREKILTLPDDTVLAPGHGPLTTVGEEKQNNPFFSAEFS